MRKILFVSLSLFFSEVGQSQSAQKSLSETKSDTTFTIHIGCPIEKSDECFRQRKGLYTQIGCRLEEQTCDKVDQERSVAEGVRVLCHYKSDNCVESKFKESCGRGFNSRWLEGPKSMAICVKSDSNTNGGPKKSP